MEKTKTDLPDFMSYKDKFTQNGFIDKVSRIAKRAGAETSVRCSYPLLYVTKRQGVCKG